MNESAAAGNDVANSTVNSEKIKLTALQESILNLMINNPEITIEEIADIIGNDRNAETCQRMAQLRFRPIVRAAGVPQPQKSTGLLLLKFCNIRNYSYLCTYNKTKPDSLTSQGLPGINTTKLVKILL